MILLVALAAVVCVGGAIVAVVARDARLAVGGMAALLLASPFVADPFPAPLVLLARVIGAAVAIELTWVAVRDTRRVEASWPEARPAGARGAAATLVHQVGAVLFDEPIELGAAAIGFVAGLASGAGSGAAAGLAPAAPLMVGTAGALVAVAATPLLIGRDPLRIGLATIEILVGAMLVRAASISAAGGPGGLEQLAIAVLVMAAGAAVAGVIVRAGPPSEFGWASDAESAEELAELDDLLEPEKKPVRRALR